MTEDLTIIGLTLEEAVIDTDEPDDPPAGWHICACSDDCGAWEPDVECDYAGCKNPAQGDGRPFCAEHHNTDEGVDPENDVPPAGWHICTQTLWKMHDWNLGKGGVDDE